MPDVQSDFTVTIHSVYNQFTRAEKKVADYTIAHPREVLFMSITELADAVGVGETSVFRFCRTVGVNGYQEFKMQMSLSMQDSEDTGPLTGHVNAGDDLTAMIQKVLSSTQKALAETAALVDQGVLDRAVDYLTDARQICFFGVGASLIAAMKANDKFSRIEPKVFCINDAHAQAMRAATMAPGDVAVVFSYAGSTKDTNAVARLAKHAGATVIAITRFQKSPLTEFTDLTLLCGANESPMQGGSSSADICQAFLTDLLYTEYYRRNYERCSSYNAKTASAVLNKLF